MTTRQFLKKAHLYISIPLLVFFIIICFSGAMGIMMRWMPSDAQWPKEQSLFWFRLHRFLLMPNPYKEVGRAIVDIVTIGMILVTISGLIIAMPKNKKQWAKMFTAVKGKSKLVRIYNVHKLLGVYLSIPILILGFSGLVFSFPRVSSWIAERLNISSVPQSKFWIGKPIEEIPYGRRLHAWAYYVHAGDWGGLFGEIVTFAVAILICVLSIYGLKYMVTKAKVRNKKMSK